MLGIDIVQNSRFKTKSIAFYEKFLSVQEMAQLTTIKNEQLYIEYIASRFASKEALYKALKGQLKQYIYSDHFAVLRQINSAPKLYISDEFKREIYDIMGNVKMHISLSHEREYSVAVVMLL